MKQKITIFFILLIALLFPLLLNPFRDLINWLSLEILNETGRKIIQYFKIDQSIYLTILSIEATGLVAYAIYWMQKRAEKEKENEGKAKARNILFSTLVASLKEIHSLSRLDLYEEQDYRFIRISEKHFEAVSEVNGLTESDISLLHNLLKELEWLVEHEKEDEVSDIRLHTDKLIASIMIPAYVQYKYDVAEPKDAFEMMNESLLSMLRKFDYAPDSDGKNQRLSQQDKTIIEYDEDGMAIVYDEAGDKLCYAFIDKNGIREGWAKLFNERMLLYEGGWKNYKRHGKGINYFPDYNDSQYISQEGTWIDGKLQNGIIHDVLVYNDGTLMEDVIQINKDFKYHEVILTEDFESHLVANLIVEDGVLAVDRTASLREIKSTYESKYGEVEWLNRFSYDYEALKKPDIKVFINNADELDLSFDSTLKVDKLSLPAKIIENKIPFSFIEYVTKEEVDEYNAKIPSVREEVKVYNEEIKNYQYAKVFGENLSFSVVNEGTLKAKDIHVTLEFPDEFIILEGSIEDLMEPQAPTLPSNPIEKNRLANLMGGSAIQKLIGASDLSALITPYPRFSSLIRPINSNNWTDLQGNTINIHCKDLLHTRRQDYDVEYVLIPTKSGVYYIKGTVICEEYVEESLFEIQVLVNEEEKRN